MKARSALLITLLNNPGYGLELQDRLQKAKIRVGQGTLYPTLRAMERDGLVSHEARGEAIEERGGRPRIYYKLTPAGKKEAQAERKTLIGLLGLTDAPKSG